VTDLTEFTAITWPDPVLAAVGVPVDAAYVERFWLPVLGPSSVMVLRHLAADLATRGERVRVVVDELARECGIPGTGSHRGGGRPIVRTLTRLEHYGMVQPHGDVWWVRTMVGELSRHHLRGLPERLAMEHTRLVAS
jgi:hypothetical protein